MDWCDHNSQERHHWPEWIIQNDILVLLDKKKKVLALQKHWTQVEMSHEHRAPRTCIITTDDCQKFPFSTLTLAELWFFSNLGSL